MTPQEQIRKLAEDAALECFPATNATDLEMSKEAIEAAIREGVKLALALPTQEMRKRGNEAIGLEQPIRPSTVWRAMAAARLRELGVEE